MDTPLPPRRARLLLRLCAGLLLACALGAALWQLLPRGLRVSARDVRVATVTRGIYRDDISVRASAEPVNAVILDSVDSGRVEQVLVRDGALVRQGQLLFRLSNPQRTLELLARKAEHAQQIWNLSNLRVAQQASNTDHQRRMADLEFALEQARKQQRRDARLAAQGFIAGAVLEEADDRLAQQERALRLESDSAATEARVKREALAQLEAAIDELRSGLKLVGASVEALAVRAPADGMLTGFRLQVGETVKIDQHIGRIDDPSRFKLAAQVDEFYLKRVAPGRRGMVQLDGRDYPVTLSRVYPQIQDGRFGIELQFDGVQPPALSPGQSVDAQLTLGEPAPALLLPNGAFANDGGGAFAYVLGPDGASAERRALRLGRRNNTQIEIAAGLAAGDKVIVSSYATFGQAARLQLTHE